MPHHVKILEMTLKFQESEAACSLGRMQCYSFGLLNLTYLTILQRTTKPCSKHSGPYIRLMYWRGSGVLVARLLCSTGIPICARTLLVSNSKRPIYLIGCCFLSPTYYVYSTHNPVSTGFLASLGKAYGDPLSGTLNIRNPCKPLNCMSLSIPYVTMWAVL